MKKYWLVIVVLIICGCGGVSTKQEGEPATCTEWISSLYSIPNCAMYDQYGRPMSFPDVVIFCRELVLLVDTRFPQCTGLLNDLLNCTPNKCEWKPELNMYLADDCNDELDRLYACN